MIVSLIAASIALTTVSQATKSQVGGQPLRASMISLGVTDMDRAIRFYSQTLGLELIGKPAEVTLIRTGDLTIALNAPLGRSAGTSIVGAVEVIFRVDSVAVSHADLAARGCHFIADPHEVTTGLWAATFTDPDGHKLTVLGAR